MSYDTFNSPGLYINKEAFPALEILDLCVQAAWTILSPMDSIALNEAAVILLRQLAIQTRQFKERWPAITIVLSRHTIPRAQVIPGHQSGMVVVPSVQDLLGQYTVDDVLACIGGIEEYADDPVDDSMSPEEMMEYRDQIARRKVWRLMVSDLLTSSNRG